MTLPNTGPLSFQLVVDEFDIQYTFTPPVSLSGDFKKLTEDETDPTAMSELYGLNAAYVANLVISSTTSGVYNIKQATLNDGWDGNSPVIVNLTVQSGAYVYGIGGAGVDDDDQEGGEGQNGSLAMRTGNFAGLLVGPINMTVDGQIAGGGGAGAGGGGVFTWDSGSHSEKGGNGGNGGTGLLIDGNDHVEISGNGNIYGGGGGGGGGNGAAAICNYLCTVNDPEGGTKTVTCYTRVIIGGGGGGGGESDGRGGPGGGQPGGGEFLSAEFSGTQSGIEGGSGGNASVNSAGNGGNGPSAQSGDLISGNGGNGGDNGNDGGNGGMSADSGSCTIDNQDSGDRAGGTRGYYINGIIQVTFTGNWNGSVGGRVT